MQCAIQSRLLNNLATATVVLIAMSQLDAQWHMSFAQENSKQEMETVWIVSQAYIPGGQKFDAEYTDEDHAKRVYESLRTTKGINGEPLYFDVAITKGQRPVSRPSSGYDPKPRDDGELGGSRSPITLPNLKIVDPGHSANSSLGFDADLLVGKKFRGTIGNVNVTFDFKSKNKVTIASGVRSLECEWAFNDKRELIISAFNADFVGSRSGQNYSGSRTPKGQRSTLPWSFELQDVEPTLALSQGTTYNDPRREIPKIQPIEETEFRMYFVERSGKRFEHEWRDRASALEKLEVWFAPGSLGFQGVIEAGVEDKNGNIINKRNR